MFYARREWNAAAVLILIVAAAMLSASAQAAGDPRFFGEYCGSHRESHTVWVPLHPLFPIPVRRTFHADLGVTAQVDYRESGAGNGLINGGGDARVDGSDIPEAIVDIRVGDVFPFVFSGVVTGHGRVQGSALAPGREVTEGSLELSADGDVITVRGLDRRLSLSKTGCGNTPPAAAIVRPTETTVPWHEIVMFGGTASDGEDASFPDERLVWTSDRDGRLGEGLNIWKNTLSPGPHRITFTVTDSGGRSASASLEIEVENHSPEVTIELPVAGGTYYADVPIVFRGRAYDREIGNLTEGLNWTYSGGFIGAGTEFLAALPEGSHRVTLSATDGAFTGRDEVNIEVGPRPAGNLAPTVVITAPPHRSAPVSDLADDCLTLTAEALDFEDGPLTGDALVWTGRMAGASETRTFTPRGASIEACGFGSTGGDTWHTITVTATDSDEDEATGTDSIEILIIAGGLI